MQLNMKNELKSYIDENEGAADTIVEVLEGEGIDINEIISSESLRKLMEKEIDEYSNELIRDLSYIDHRAEPGDICIDEIHSHGDGDYLLEFSYRWSFYSGCADMDGDGKIEDNVTFCVKKDGLIVFNFLTLEGPSTDSEF